jgi:hypothetical protein
MTARSTYITFKVTLRCMAEPAGINSNTSLYLPASRRSSGSKYSSAKDGANVDFAGAKIYPVFCRTRALILASFSTHKKTALRRYLYGGEGGIRTLDTDQGILP